MIWQDVAATLIQFILVGCLFPTIGDKSPSRPHLWTSVPTALCLLALGAVMLSLDLYLTALTLAVQSGLWAFIAVQRARGH